MIPGISIEARGSELVQLSQDRACTAPPAEQRLGVDEGERTFPRFESDSNQMKFGLLVKTTLSQEGKKIFSERVSSSLKTS